MLLKKYAIDSYLLIDPFFGANRCRFAVPRIDNGTIRQLLVEPAYRLYLIIPRTMKYIHSSNGAFKQAITGKQKVANIIANTAR